MIYPRINNNGTSGQELLELNLTALTALRLARKAVGEANPNGRDYQTLPAGTYALAVDEARNRIQRLDAITAEIAAIVDDISAQNGEIEQRKRDRFIAAIMFPPSA